MSHLPETRTQSCRLLAESPPVAFVMVVWHNPNRAKNLSSSPLGKLKKKKRSSSPLDLASRNLGGVAIVAAAAFHMQQPNCDSMPNIERDIVSTVTDI